MSEAKRKAARAKAYLERLEQCDARINAMQDKIDSLFEQATNITSTLRQDVVSGGGSRDKIGDPTAKAVDLGRKVEQQKSYYVDLQNEANEILNKLQNNVYYTILYRRYMLGDEWDVIAAEIGKGVRWTQSLHGYALVAFADLLPGKYSSEAGGAEKGQNGA